jgi:hypothetical protein
MALHPAKQDIVLEKLTNNSFHEIYTGSYYLYSRLLEYIDNYMKFKDYYTTMKKTD